MDRLARKRLEKLCENIWRQIIRLPCECDRCERKGKIQWFDAAHVFTREIPSLKFELDNGVCLCRLCHRWWQHNGHEADFIEWFKGKHPERYERLVLLKQTIRKIDLETTLQELQAIYYERITFLT
jgi:hypothetical protein